MKLALAALLLFSALPADAKPSRLERIQRVNSQSGWSQEEQCIKTVYREEYVPGTMKSPGYITTFKEKVAVPCEGRNVASPISSGDEISHYPGTRRRYYHDGSYSTYYPTRYERPAPVDNNSVSKEPLLVVFLVVDLLVPCPETRQMVGNSPWCCWWCHGWMSN